MRRGSALLLALCLYAVPVAAQTPTAPSNGPGNPPATGPAAATGPTGSTGATGVTGSQRPMRIEDFPPPIRIGVRAEAVRRAWPAIPIVVIVPDEISYLEALAAWTPEARYPVLIDDGTQDARENIARFVRGFTPKSVVRWSAAEALKDSPEGVPTWPVNGEDRKAAFQRALFRAWSAKMPGEETAPTLRNPLDLIARWKTIGVISPGMVVSDPSDPAWTAALALAIGRCQPICWIPVAGGINATLPPDEFNTFEDKLEAAADRVGLTWRELGDDLDAVALCLNCPAKVQVDGSSVVALTDLVARLPKDGEKQVPRDQGQRWAWAGQIFGNQSQAAYRAMCSLFLSSRRAWLFDGYPDSGGWQAFDASLAAKRLTEAGFNPTLSDTPQQNDRVWRLRTAWPIEAGFIAVNSKGGADEFNVEPGQLRPGDIPFLTIPSIVYFVHSFSAAVPGERGTVAGRWFERGAYAYLGSTQEPMLQAFVPTPLFCVRMTNSFPWAVAVRPDNTTKAWKLATFGDPLLTLGPPVTRSEKPLPLQNTHDLTDLLREAASQHHYEDAIATLTMLGRDSEAAKLAAALLRDEAKAFTPTVAAVSVLPLYRSKDVQTLLKAFGVMDRELAADPVRRDALWHACYEGLSGSNAEAILNVLRFNLRPDQVGRDAADLARPMASSFSRDAAITLLKEARTRATSDWDRQKVDQALEQFSTRPIPKK